VLGVALASPASSYACEETSAPLHGDYGTPTPFDRLGCNLVDTAAPQNLLLYGAAILSTVELSATGADHDVRVAFERYAESPGFSDATVAIGYIGLPAIGAALYGTGLVRSDRRLEGAGAAALQAMSVTFAATVLLKVATGRPYPQHGGDPTSPDRLQHPEWAREWNGPRSTNTAWPSGHTSVAVSLASSLTSYWIDALWVGALAYPAAGAIAVGVVSGARHWLSDAVAGALLGQAVGWTVGRDFRRMQDARNSPDPDLGTKVRAPTRSPMEVRVVPLPGTNGVALVGYF
jgi:membrane-associated phospholipid phosphatase